MDTYDLAVIGGGTTGLVAAQVAAVAGARTLLIERKRTGGDCLWTGCVPSKSLLAAAAVAQTMRIADRVGIEPSEPKIDRARIAGHVVAARSAIAPHDSPETLRHMGIDVIEGHARFLGGRRLAVDAATIAFRAALIATGSAPSLPPVEGLDACEPLTTDTLWDRLAHLPDEVAVVGGGPTGCELAQGLARLGHEVTLVEAAPHLLPALDADVGRLVAERLAAEGGMVLTGAPLTRAVRDGETVTLGIGDGQGADVAARAVIVATGRTPVTDGLGLDAAGVRTDPRGAVVVDATLRTTAAGIFAGGDVTGGPNLTHLAAQHGSVAATNALFLLRRRPEHRAIPHVVHTDPEIAHVGLTAEHARERLGSEVDVVEVGAANIDRAITDGRDDAWVRLVAARGRLVGATIVAPHAGESVAVLADVIRRRGRLDEVASTLHPYPTYSIAVYEAAARRRIASLAGGGARRVTAPLLAALRAASR
ncbi:MAG: dihydrolipoyl dehydrogenase family protein, partial [Nitriliruptorales bacterium]